MILKIFGLALIGAFMTFILKAFGWKGAPLVAVASIIVLTGIIIERFESVQVVFETLAKQEGMAESCEYLLKILGIGYVSGISADICRELGEGGVASVIATVARIESLIIILPLVIEIMTLGLELV